jgi:hypothetical protein
MKALVLATLAAILVQPVILFMYIFLPSIADDWNITGADLREVLEMSLYVWVVASAFVVGLGLPIFFALKHRGRHTALPLGLAGFCASGISAAILFWPYWTAQKGSSFSATWHGQYVDFVKDGVPTMYQWLSYAEGIIYYGAHGLVGALVFFAVWRAHEPQQGVPADRPRPTGSAGG